MIRCEIVEAEYITGSDHKIVLAKIGTGIIQKTRSRAKEKRLKEKKRILKLDKAQEEDWERYKANLEEKLKKKLGVVGNVALAEENFTSISIDEMWDAISSSILESAYTNLPSQKVSSNGTSPKKLRSSDKIHKDLRCLGRICYMCFKKVEQNIDEEELQQANKEINRLNSEYEIQIERIYEKQWTNRRGEDLKV